MSYAKIIATVAIVVGALLGVVACGKSSGDEDKLSRTALPARANPICEKARAELEAVNQPIGITNPAQGASYFRTLQRSGKKAANALRKLKPDDDVKADYDAYLAAERRRLRLVDKIVDKAEAKDRSGLSDVKRLRGVARRSRAAARKAGLSGCAY